MRKSPRAFLLSPASCSGKRAALVLDERACFPLARRLRSGEASISEVFAFVSGLYFRGKLAYALSFASELEDGPAIRIITPTRGLLRPDAPASAELLHEFAEVDVDARESRYRLPLERDALAWRDTLPRRAEVVLLGSVATPKYVSVLDGIFGKRLYYPETFAGRGDMSRGALLLRAVREGRELGYAPLLQPATPRRARP